MKQITCANGNVKIVETTSERTKFEANRSTAAELKVIRGARRERSRAIRAQNIASR